MCIDGVSGAVLDSVVGENRTRAGIVYCASYNVNRLINLFTYRVAQKIGTIFVRLNNQILTDFYTHFVVKIGRKFVVMLSLKLTPHLKCVATLPCEM